MGKHFVVDELVGFGGLDHAVEGHDAAHAGIFEDHQMLAFGAHFMQQLVDLEPLPVSLVESFLKVAHGCLPWHPSRATPRRLQAG